MLNDKYIYGMQLEYLRSFLEVYRTGSVTSAARSMNITQPAVSNHIKALEQAVGKPLFQRIGRGIAPTPVADELAHAISSPLDTLEKTLGFIKGRTNTIEGTVYISGPGEFIQFAATKIMAELLPLNIRLRVRPGYRDCITEDLDKGEADLAFLAEPYRPDIYDHKVIMTERLIPVASAEWAHKHFDSCRNLETLIQKPIIAYDEDLSLIKKFFKDTINADCTQSPIVSVHDLRIVMEFLFQGHGFSVLPDYICRKPLMKRKLVQLIDSSEAPMNNIHLVWPKIKLRDPRVFFVKNYIERAFEQRQNF